MGLNAPGRSLAFGCNPAKVGMRLQNVAGISAAQWFYPTATQALQGAGRGGKCEIFRLAPGQDAMGQQLDYREVGAAPTQALRIVTVSLAARATLQGALGMSCITLASQW